jgi:hypothetical protein
MKKNCLLILVLIIAFSSCQKDPASNAKKTGTDSQSLSYNNSYSAWLTYKGNVHNSYSYTTLYTSFTGRGTEIKTGVSNGSIVSRDYTSYQYVQTSATKTIIEQWHEDKTTLNTHGTEAGDLMTLDDVYTKAKNVWLKADPKANDIYFETKNNGLISSCGYTPVGCQDDCFTGINISSISSQ